MQNEDEAKKTQPVEPPKTGKDLERGNEGAPRRRRGPYGPIRSGRYAQRTPRNAG